MARTAGWRYANLSQQAVFRLAQGIIQMINRWALAIMFLTSYAVLGNASGRPAGDASSAPLTASPSVAVSTMLTSAHFLSAPDVEAWLDGFLPYALARADVAGAAISVVKDGQVLFKKGYGYADVATKRPMDPDITLVRSGSVSKLFTWTAVMQLVASGQIGLDADINSYLDFKVVFPDGRPVTMRDLMAHRGGFEEGLKSILMTDPSKAISTEQYIKENPRPIVFTPGAVPAYSNYGAALAGYIVQRVSGEPFEDYVDAHIFEPLGMKRSTFRQPVPANLEPDLSKGYFAGSAAPHPFEFVSTAPAGSMSTTAGDMAQFMLAYLQQGRVATGELLSPETVATMQAPNQAGRPGFASMTYGFFDEERNGRRILGHGGDTILFHSDLFLLPEEGVGIYYTLNSRGAKDSNYALRDTLFNSFMDRYFPAPKQATADASLATAIQDAADISGHYESSRRIQTGFLSLFYLLDQTEITGDPDGTINVPDRLAGEPKSFHEIEPNVWQDTNGPRRLFLTMQDGRKTIIDGADPTSVLQAVPLLRAAKWNLPALTVAIGVIALTLLLWPVGALLRRYYKRPLERATSPWHSRLIPRLVAAAASVFVLGWFSMLKPILASDFSVYNTASDPKLRALQLMGVVLILATGVSIWFAISTVRRSERVLAKIGAVLLAASMLDLVWVGVACKLIDFSISY
jgi:CubicO group peptidase (beta-lactamase class C family)